jgi:hypothetical protein
MAAVRRILVTVVAGLAWLVASAPPAAAHAVSGVGATNWRTTLAGLTPTVPGLSLRVIELGSRLQLTNRTGRDVVVLGYQGEPYLRVGPGGVFENTRSPATYLNRTRSGGTTVPGDADPGAPPAWRRVSNGTTARWHDHRVHWMGGQPPPRVRRAPGRHHVVVPRWEVEMRLDGRAVVAHGTLEWVPGPSPVPWLALAALAAGAGVAAALPRRWPATLAAALGLLVAVDVAHLTGIAWAAAGGVGQRALGALGSGFYSLLAWGAAGVAFWLLARGRRADACYPAAFAAFLVALVGGLADVTDLYRSQVPFAGPAALARLLVAVSLGLGAGVVGAAVLALRRLRPAPVAGPAAARRSPAGRRLT